MLMEPPPRQVDIQTCLADFRENSQAEQWMHARLANFNIPPLVIGDVVMFSTHRIVPPPEFRDRWHRVGEPHQRGQLSELEMAQLAGAEACLLFSDIYSKHHRQLVGYLTEAVSASLGPEAPPIILLSHSATRDAEHSADSEATFEAWSEAVGRGCDDVILEDLCGHKLCLEIQSRIMHQRHAANVVNDKVNEQHQESDYARELEECVYDLVWMYLRVRLQTHLPEIHPEFGQGRPRMVDGSTVCEKVGTGSMGIVCKLMDSSHKVSEVVKMIDKAPITNTNGIKRVARQIDVMEALSSKASSHPNVMKFFQVYHTETHVIFRMEYGGPSDLNKRLLLRESAQHGKPLSVDRTVDILTHCLNAICHIHVNARIAHRNIKPASFRVVETPEKIDIMLVDFDNALVEKPGHQYRGILGTFPFFAPEMALDESYDPFAADIWSLGVLFLTVLSHLSIFKKAVGVSVKKNAGRWERREAERQMMGIVKEYFSTPGRVHVLLNTHCRPELRGLLKGKGAQVVQDAMLKVAVDQRWKAEELLNAEIPRMYAAVS